ncbi:proprotein convertase subtilisin/kexin type 4-like [Mercenaria mercenaria]|uniref:proprotein convertase subtilisin/kexin type 4-like n=1 Tax=Mercenaria mercenaria TaxID=6596 RepID=UPI00234E9B53|nr:proprotein convertase subtilisin/kexin type 4-like [Mercenaria mercenaria]
MNSKRKCQANFLVGLVVVFLSFQFVPSSARSNIEQYKKLTIKMKPYFRTTVFEEFRKFNLSLLFKINPTTYIFEFVGDNSMDTLQRVLDIYKHQIAQWEAVRVYDNTIKPDGTVVELQRYFGNMYAPNLVCSNYYGMDISKAWSRGYTGKGVTVGITGVGINTDLLDLQQNIDERLCMNFVNNSKDVTPEYYNNIRAISDIKSDHDNRIASIVAATKGNNFCSAGVAYNATIAALKIFQLKLYQGITLDLYPGHWTASDIMAKAFVYNIANIDIFVNAWTTPQTFDKLDLATSEALQYGAVSGRKGFGVVYLVPAGPVGNGLSNNNNTITVNSVGRQGTIQDGAYTDTSVITSGLGQGNNLTA